MDGLVMTNECCLYECDCGPDVRGMCFCCIGDLTKMDADHIKKIQKCDKNAYAIAHWFHCNIYNELYYNHDQTPEVMIDLFKKFIKRDDMKNLHKIIFDRSDDFLREIKSAFNDLLRDPPSSDWIYFPRF